LPAWLEIELTNFNLWSQPGSFGHSSNPIPLFINLTTKTTPLACEINICLLIRSGIDTKGFIMEVFLPLVEQHSFVGSS